MRAQDLRDARRNGAQICCTWDPRRRTMQGEAGATERVLAVLNEFL